MKKIIFIFHFILFWLYTPFSALSVHLIIYLVGHSKTWKKSPSTIHNRVTLLCLLFVVSSSLLPLSIFNKLSETLLIITSVSIWTFSRNYFELTNDWQSFLRLLTITVFLTASKFCPWTSSKTFLHLVFSPMHLCQLKKIFFWFIHRGSWSVIHPVCL